MKKKHEILLSSGEKNRLAAAMNVSRMTVYRALTFQRNTPLAERIRFTAVKHFGGAEVGNKEQGIRNRE